MCSREDWGSLGKRNPARVTNHRKHLSDSGSSWAENSWRLEEFKGEVLYACVFCRATVVVTVYAGMFA